MRNTAVQFHTFIMKKLSGVIRGADYQIHQSVTKTECYVNKLFCVPIEQTKAILIWKPTKHDFHSYHNMGIFHVHRMNDFFLIAKLGIGGTLIEENKGWILLDNTYVLDKNIVRDDHLTGIRNNTKKFVRLAKEYAENTTSNVERDLFEGRLAKHLLQEQHIMATMAAVACNAQREIFNLQRLVLRNFPEMANELIFNEEGTVVEPVGDALLVKKCELVMYSEIFWNQSINDVCFQHFPVKTLAGEIKFLELSTRRVYNASEPMSCESRSDHLFVRDKHDTYWKYTCDKGFRKVKLRFQQDLNDKLSLPKLASYNSRLRHYSPVTPHRTTLLSILASQRSNLREINDLKKRGGGSVLQGIFSGITEVVETMSETGVTIVHSIAKGITHLTNDSVEVVTEVGGSVAGIFNFAGGTSNFVLYVINFFIIAYLVVKHIAEYRMRRRVPEAPRIVRVIESPPLPPKRNRSQSK